MTFENIMADYCVICDLDNTFTDSREWEPHRPFGSNRKGWDNYVDYHYTVKPNLQVINYLLTASDFVSIYFITGREDRLNLRAMTEAEIADFSKGHIKIGEFHKLLMRSENDFDVGWKVKKKLLERHVLPEKTPILAIDDDLDTVKMYNAKGIPIRWYDIEKQELRKELPPLLK